MNTSFSSPALSASEGVAVRQQYFVLLAVCEIDAVIGDTADRKFVSVSGFEHVLFFDFFFERLRVLMTK